MNRLPAIWRWVQEIVKRRVVNQQIDEELRFHIEQRAVENIAAGMSPEVADREARKRFGNVQSVGCISYTKRAANPVVASSGRVIPG